MTVERSTILKLGKSTISTGPFSMSQTVNVYQRVLAKNSVLNNGVIIIYYCIIMVLLQ